MEILDSKVLVLNKLYSPITTTTVRSAFCKIVSEAAEIITVENGIYMSHDFKLWSDVSGYKKLIQQGRGSDSNIQPRNYGWTNY